MGINNIGNFFGLLSNFWFVEVFFVGKISFIMLKVSKVIKVVGRMYLMWFFIVLLMFVFWFSVFVIVVFEIGVMKFFRVVLVRMELVKSVKGVLSSFFVGYRIGL